MFKQFYPFEYVESVSSIDYQKLYSKGYRGIIFDIDNTLVLHGKDSTKSVDDLFRAIHGIGFKTLLLSNNSEERIARFLKNIDSLYISNAQKPDKAGYLKAIEMMNIKKEEAVFIGDQLFTDIYGANKGGIDSVLVRYLRPKDEKKIGIRRNLEKIVLKFYEMNKSCQNRIGDIQKGEFNNDLARRKRLFCEINPVFYAVSVKKMIWKRHLKNLLSAEKFAGNIQKERLPDIVSSCSSSLIKKGKGIDVKLQKNKAVNIGLANSKINGIVINPGEIFSFWKTVGKITREKGYSDGRVIQKNSLQSGMGGGLCNLSNTIHWLVLHSPLDVIEFHSHSDALAPDEGKRIPFSSGTSIFYNYIDFRFKNNTTQVFQLRLWCDNDKLYGELRSEKEFPCCYELVEENHRFEKEDEKYYRISKIYKQTIERTTGKVLDKKLVRDNHSEVMFDYSLIPEDQIAGCNAAD